MGWLLVVVVEMFGSDLEGAIGWDGWAKCRTIAASGKMEYFEYGRWVFCPNGDFSVEEVLSGMG